MKALMVEFRLPYRYIPRFRKNPFKFLTKLYNLCHYKYPYMFNSIELDIYNVCNRSCEYCPNSKYKIPPHKMDEKLFHRIIDQLSAMKYNGRILLHRFGEPLLDDRLDNFVKYINEKCDYARIELFTNGDYLDYARFKELLEAGVDYFEITQHSNTLSEANMSLFRNMTIAEKSKVKLLMSAQIYLCNRGGEFGSIRKEDYFKDIKRPCYHPCGALIVDSYGKVVICCNDYHSSVVLGDLNNQSLMEIWKSEQFDKVRKKLAYGNRELFEICKKCDA